MVATQEEPCAYAKLLGRLDGQEFQCYVTSLPSTLGRSSGTSGTDGDRKPAGFIDLGKSKAISREHATIDWAPAERKYKITCLGKNGMVVGGKYTSRGGVAALGSRTPIKLGPAHLYFLLPENVESAGGAAAGAGEQSPSNGDLGPVVRPVSSMSGPDVVETPRKEQPPPTTPGHHQSPQGRPQTGGAQLVSPTAPVVVAKAPSVPFNEMVDKAFGSPELSAIAAAEGLSSGDVQNWIMQNFPVWNEEGAKMRTLAVGIEAVLAENYTSSGADRWKESPIHAAMRVKLPANHRLPVVASAGAPTSEQPGAQASSNGTLPHVSPAAPGMAAGFQVALGHAANAEQAVVASAHARQPAQVAVPATKVAVSGALQPAACANVVGAVAAGSGMGILVQGNVGGEEDGGGIDVGIEDHM